jgi:hypothetical protein
MNGRMYDYNLGRFLSVDPFIHGAGNSQGINPYSYILNNPLAGTDPTGYAPQCDSSGEAICEGDNKGEPKEDKKDPKAVGVIIEKVKERRVSQAGSRIKRKEKQVKGKVVYENGAVAPYSITLDDKNKGTSVAIGSATQISKLGLTNNGNGPSSNWGEGVISYFKGINNYFRHEARTMGELAAGEAAQANAIESSLLGLALQLARQGTHQQLLNAIDPAVLAGKLSASIAVTSEIVKKLIKSGNWKFVGAAMGTSFNLISNAGNLYRSLENLAIKHQIYISTIDHTKPFIPQLKNTPQFGTFMQDMIQISQTARRVGF